MALGITFTRAKLTIEAFGDSARKDGLKSSPTGGNTLEAMCNPETLTVRHESAVFTLPRHTSAVQLDRALVLLVRPDRRGSLQIGVPAAEASSSGPLELRGGQPGVFYGLRDDSRSPVGRPGYFHQRDEVNPELNKGITQLRLGVDFVLARPGLDPNGQRARTPPSPPRIETGPLPIGTVLHVAARKAMSGITAEFDGPSAISPLPTVRVEPASVAVGAAAKLVIEASVAGERYRLFLGDQLVAEAVGTGAPIELDTGPLAQRAVFSLAVERADGEPVVVSRRIVIAVEVSP